MKLPASRSAFWVGLAWLRSANRWAAQESESCVSCVDASLLVPIKWQAIPVRLPAALDCGGHSAGRAKPLKGHRILRTVELLCGFFMRRPLE